MTRNSDMTTALVADRPDAATSPVLARVARRRVLPLAVVCAAVGILGTTACAAGLGRGESALESAAAESVRPGQVFRDCDVCPEMVVVPARGKVAMWPESEVGRDDSEGHVTIAEPFAIGVKEGDGCGVGRVRARRRVRRVDTNQVVCRGWRQSGNRCELARRGGVRAVVVGTDGAGVPAAERRRVGARGAGWHGAGEPVQVGLVPDARRRVERVGAVRNERGWDGGVDGGLLERGLFRCAREGERSKIG